MNKAPNFPNLEPTIQAAMHANTSHHHDYSDDEATPEAPTSSDAAAAKTYSEEMKRRIEEMEAEEEEERRLRDPLGLVDIAPLPPDQLLGGEGGEGTNKNGADDDDDGMDMDYDDGGGPDDNYFESAHQMDTSFEVGLLTLLRRNIF